MGSKDFQPEGKKGGFWKAEILEEGTSEVGGCSRGIACGNIGQTACVLCHLSSAVLRSRSGKGE
jgi:hypothetical protein